MNKQIKALGMFAMVGVMSSCSLGTNSFPITSYFVSLPYSDNFTILQLSDLHMSVYDDFDEDMNFVKYQVKDNDPDLIILTGDIFTYASKTLIQDFFKYIDSFGVPWTITYGNHDEQVYASNTYVVEYLNTFGSHCLFKYLDDNITGQTNNVINLVQDSKVVYQLFVMDSNSYWTDGYFGYNYVHEDQINWYKKAVEEVNIAQDASWKLGDGSTVPSLLFMHIPFPEYLDAYTAYKKGEAVGSGENREGVSCPKYNSGFYDVLKEYSSTKGVFVGHDHINNSAIWWNGIELVYGAKSTDNIYYDPDMLGCRSITLDLNSEETFTTSTHYYTYSEVANG